MDEQIKKIISRAIHAPSGENCQPWKFKISGNTLSVFNLPERDPSLYNFQQRGSLVAHGALLENILIAASDEGLAGAVTYFPDDADKNRTFKIIFSKHSAAPDGLSPYIEQRFTNRKPYQKKTIDAEIITQLNEQNKLFQNAQLKLATNRGEILTAAKAASTNERLLFENQSMHQFFFNHINWTLDEDNKKSVGFYLKTLELPPPAQMMFKLARQWNRLKFLNKLGFSKLVSKANEQNYQACGAVAIISLPNILKEEMYIETGRLLERTWLCACKLDLAIQPMTGILFLHQTIKAKGADALNSAQKEIVEQSYATINNINGAPNRTSVMLFRLGYGSKPSARSSRLPPIISIF